MLSMRHAAVALTLSASAMVWAPVPAHAQARIDVPIVIGGGDGQMAQCGSGQIVGLDPRGDGFLSVLSSPGGRGYREIDRLYNGQEVFMCGQQGPWVGVVYRGARPAPSDCNVTRAWAVRQPYTGPCAYGWVHQRYVRLIAG